MSAADLSLHEQVHALYSNHHGWLYGWLRRKLGCPHQAADVAHDTFERVLAARDSLFGVEQPRAWLTTTATRLIIDEARRERLRQAYLAELSLFVQANEGYPSPEQTLVALQALEQLSAVLEAVSPKARAAFVRHYLDGATMATVATELGVSARMVGKYLAQVLVQCARLAVLP
ncbi:sigma-70 family RNA polymerase sigma factor [Hydrogenophaga sp.]|uniref:sigma-70 family RNA polymerase sigma factor n=1 Tax=Hydrogenophaga sp. TaxID=1904254 RepID=UPI002FCA9580